MRVKFILLPHTLSRNLFSKQLCNLPLVSTWVLVCSVWDIGFDHNLLAILVSNSLWQSNLTSTFPKGRLLVFTLFFKTWQNVIIVFINVLYYKTIFNPLLFFFFLIFPELEVIVFLIFFLLICWCIQTWVMMSSIHINLVVANIF